MVSELAMVLVATALTRISFVQTRVPIEVDDVHFKPQLKHLFHEDDMTPEFTEQLRRSDHEDEKHRRNQLKHEKYDLMIQRRSGDRHEGIGPKRQSTHICTNSTELNSVNETEVNKNELKERAQVPPFRADSFRSFSVPEEPKKIPNEEVDIVDREDHVTQYLAELLVNTDSEITSLTASENDDEREIQEVKEDQFFAFLTGQEKVLEGEGSWTGSSETNDNYLPSVIDTRAD